MTNRIEDLIEKARHYEDLWHEAIDENKRLQQEIDLHRQGWDANDEYEHECKRTIQELRNAINNCNHTK